ncbi:hypothetical protein Y032_0831g2584 [Ancylostoma ceylanicum]|uniref:Uncharacterized protein n=1 Tax=Ancylostoma ceylanicum TaxID=53326 RepID=A0A016WB85_9BILA|nr:hypothetical protein Y032_0831g2584 [Ancylostoma ceylanicum]
MLGNLTSEGRLSRKRKKLKTSESLASLFLDAIVCDTDIVCNLHHGKSSPCVCFQDFSKYCKLLDIANVLVDYSATIQEQYCFQVDLFQPNGN